MNSSKTLLIKIAVAALVALMFAPLAQAQQSAYQEGVHYFEIEGGTAPPHGQQEVVEAFSYLCTHCNTFEPYIQSWLKRKPESVTFRRIPVVFGRSSWELYARGYVTAELMGVGDDAHGALMDRLWKEKKILRSIEELADFYADFGADPEKFLSTSQSFAVDGKIRKDQLQVQTFGIRGTPALVVNGKFRVVGSQSVPSFDAMLDVVDYLLEREATVAGGTAAHSATGK